MLKLNGNELQLSLKRRWRRGPFCNKLQHRKDRGRAESGPFHYVGPALDHFEG